MDTDPSVAASARLASGGFVTVFPSQGSGPVRFQTYDSAGQPVGSPVQVSSSGGSPDVIGLSSGGWAVVWRDGGTENIQAQVFDAHGAAVANAVVVSEPTPAGQYLATPHVTAGANDAFIVSWLSGDPFGHSTVRLRVVDGGNTPITSELAVRPSNSPLSDLTTLADGRVLLSSTSHNADGGANQLKVGIFDPVTNRIVNDSFISISATNNFANQHVTQLAGSQVLVSWTEYAGGTTYIAHAELFDSGGVSLGQGFTRVGAFQDIAALDDGSFVATFGDGTGAGAVTGQVFDVAAQPLGGAFTVNDPAGESAYASILVPFGTDDFGVFFNYFTPGNVADASFQLYQSVINGSSGPDALDGTAAVDILRGLDGDDRLSGLGGGDLLIGGAGADRLDGGPGFDTASYDDSAAAVTVNLAAGTGVGGTAAGDVLVSIENLIGSSFDDMLVGDGGANRLEGGAGNDRLVGGAGADMLIGGAGIDLADYGASSAGVTIGLLEEPGQGGDAAGDTLFGIENLRGSAFADVLGGDAAANHLEGLGGDDLLLGSVNADVLDGGTGQDEVSYAGSLNRVTVNLATGAAQGGDAQGDTLISIENLSGSNQGDTLSGDAGPNTLHGLAGDDLLAGGHGADTLTGDAGNDALFGNAGGDVILGGDGNDYIDGQEDGDFILGGDGNDTLYGGTGVDLLGGEAGNDELHGGADGDNLYGGAGSDVILGDAGNDYIDGQQDGDFILGGYGDDTLFGGKGVDLVGGEAGNDELHGGADGDNLYGGSGSDLILGEDGDDTIDGQEDGDFILGGAGNDILRGGAGVDLLGGEDGNDQLFGGTDGDNLYGAGGIDALFGEDGDDRIDGGDGGDILGGNAGRDTLTGGAGADTFLFFSTADSPSVAGADVITDFVSGSDRIDLSAIDANTTLTGDQAFQFLGYQSGPTGAGTLSLGFVQDVGIFLYGYTDADATPDLVINLGTFNLQGTDLFL